MHKQLVKAFAITLGINFKLVHPFRAREEIIYRSQEHSHANPGRTEQRMSLEEAIPKCCIRTGTQLSQFERTLQESNPG